MIRWFALVGVLSLALVIGCAGRKEVPSVPVTGTVNLDGAPLNDGTINFAGEEGTVSDVLKINNGTFEGKVKVGPKKVQIYAYRPGKAPPTVTESPGEFKENYLPEKYNVKSTLTAEVSATGPNDFKFDVSAK